MYTNATENSVMLYLRNDFDTIIFEIIHKLYSAPGSAPPPPLVKNCGCAPEIKWSITLISFALQQVYDTNSIAHENSVYPMKISGFGDVVPLVRQKFTSVSEESSGCIFEAKRVTCSLFLYPYNEEKGFHWKAGKFLRDCTASHPRRF